jgi:hypothetical protein
MKRRGAGRPTKLTPARAKVIVDAIRGGNTRACAAACAGIHQASLEEWIKRGRDGDAEFAAFAEQIRDADGFIEKKVVANLIRHATKGDHKAALEWLGRRRSKTWGDKPTKLEVKVDGELDMTTLSDEELDQLLALIGKTKKAEP